MTSVILDNRSQAEIFAEALALAELLTPEWAAGFPKTPVDGRYDDPGLAMLQLFAELHVQLNGPLNAVSSKYQLAFWDFMGISLRAPKAAEAPIWFQLKGSTPTTIPKGTQIASTTDKSVTFETASDLPLLPATLQATYAVRPEADAYSNYSDVVDGSGTPFPLFADDPNQVPIPHAFFISDPNFDTGKTEATLTLSLSGINLTEAYFGQWFAADGSRLQPLSVTESFDQLSAVFDLKTALPTGEVDGISAQWIKVTPNPGVRILPFLQNSLPRVFLSTATIEIDGMAADSTYYNATIVDLKKGGYPLGKMPAVEDAFYIAAKAPFSKSGAELSLQFDLQTITPPEQAVLAWEYWDGDAWSPLTVRDQTRNLTMSGAVTFVCPQIVETKVNKVNNYWVRVRLTQGGYGTAQGRLVTMPADKVVNTILAPFITNSDAAIKALESDDIDFGYVFKPANFTPPYISKLSITSTSTFGPQALMSLNGYDYAPFDGAPYKPVNLDQPTVFLGFSEDGFADHVIGQDLTLYIAFENEDPSLLPTVTTQADALTLGFEYYNGEVWSALKVAKITGDFQSEGILVLQIPDDIVPSTMFDAPGYWVRVTPPASQQARLSDVRGIFPNCVAAFNALTWTNVTLGSATGEPSQQMTFPKSPVLENPIVQVLETVPGGQNGQDVDTAWITWTEVSNFDFAGPLDRAYVLNHTTGTLTFGDGEAGMVPPKGPKNVRAAWYRSGGGTQGNRPIGDLTKLKSALSTVQSVTNVEVAVGGVDADQVSDLETRAPQQVRAGDRAVTASDFRALAITASQQVARAAVATSPGAINVVVLPQYAGATPLPSYDLRNLVGDYLSDRALPVAVPMLSVGGPTYVDIDATVSVILAQGTTQEEAYQALVAIFDTFLLPLTGGTAGTGWEFGATVRASDIASAMATAKGVEMVDGLTLGLDLQFMAMAWNELPTAGALTMEVVSADAI